MTVLIRTALVVIAGLLLGSSLVRGDATFAQAAPDGKTVFLAHCSSCHQATGLGAGPFPPLAGNADVVSSDTGNLINIALNGKVGPITINGKQYSGAMPAWKGQLTNAEIAAALTYIRSSWGNKAALISEDQVAAAAKPAQLSGDAIFAAKCATCHQATGAGTATIPPLDGNPHVTAADPSAILTTIVNGRNAPLIVNGKTYNGQMPSWKGQLSNPDVAAVATYIRSAWSNKAPGVTEQMVAAAGPVVSTAVGQAIFAQKCVACHKASGQGISGVFPALAGNPHVNAADATAILGTIEHGRNAMPSWKGQLSSADIAAVATYIRSAWGNKGGPVSEADVASVK